MRRRLQKLVASGHITQNDLEQFLLLEMKMNGGLIKDDWLLSYHMSDDDYSRLLEKVLKGLCAIGEPFATEKLHTFLKELGTQLPAVYGTPWEMTLTELDKEFGL